MNETVGKLRIIDARESSEVMDEITGMGLDIDQGMVLKLDGQIYYGSDAIHALSLIGTRSGFFFGSTIGFSNPRPCQRF